MRNVQLLLGVTKRRRQPRVLSGDQCWRLLGFIDDSYGTMVLAAQCLGLLVSEVMGLQWPPSPNRSGLAFLSGAHRVCSRLPALYPKTAMSLESTARFSPNAKYLRPEAWGSWEEGETRWLTVRAARRLII